MPKQKRKNDQFLRRHTRLFIALSGLAYAIAWGGCALLISVLFRLFHLTMKQTHAIGFALISLFIAFVQVQLVERLYRHSMRWWLLATFIGVLATLPFYRNDPEWPSTISIFIAPLIPIALAQTVWLWRRVRWVWLWLWPLASVVSLFASMYAVTMLSKVLPFVRPYSDASHFVMGLTYGLLQGFAMSYLWTKAAHSEKTKNDSAMHEAPDEQRFQHLEDGKSENTLPDAEENLMSRKSAY